ncbi:hypothetical protein CDAR_477431 [Caerostris darwini]|uniref:Uncharacterized protein n=1 Tax=Caerostris darwini TaxID=1538125 RepID=A0AAV4PXP6_9ARAC|nr:hypothetical protein CDAR_477431 [Caerostris darwini]
MIKQKQIARKDESEHIAGNSKSLNEAKEDKKLVLAALSQKKNKAVLHSVIATKTKIVYALDSRQLEVAKPS